MPAPQRTVRTVFLSSTARDLGPHREAAAKAIAGLDGFHLVRMEDFGARDGEADDFCRARIAECDVFLGLVGHLYGSSPEGQESSFTEREYDAAVEAGIPRLLFLASDDFPMPPSLREPDEKWQQQQRFRERIRNERIVAFFDLPDRLATQVIAALRNLEREIPLASGGAVSMSTTVRVEGSGAAAVGAGSVAAGEGGVVVGGSVHGDIVLGGRPDRKVRSIVEIKVHRHRLDGVFLIPAFSSGDPARPDDIFVGVASAEATSEPIRAPDLTMLRAYLSDIEVINHDDKPTELLRLWVGITDPESQKEIAQEVRKEKLHGTCRIEARSRRRYNLHFDAVFREPIPQRDGPNRTSRKLHNYQKRGDLRPEVKWGQ